MRSTDILINRMYKMFLSNTSNFNYLLIIFYEIKIVLNCKIIYIILTI